MKEYNVIIDDRNEVKIKRELDVLYITHTKKLKNSFRKVVYRYRYLISTDAIIWDNVVIHNCHENSKKNACLYLYERGSDYRILYEKKETLIESEYIIRTNEIRFDDRYLNYFLFEIYPVLGLDFGNINPTVLTKIIPVEDQKDGNLGNRYRSYWQ